MMKHEMMMNANMEVLENMFDEYIENGKIKLEGTNLVGETYKVKEYIKDFGGKWNKDVKGWNIAGTLLLEIMEARKEGK